MKILMNIIVLILLFVSTCHAGFWDISAIGIDYTRGDDRPLPNAWQNSKCFNKAHRISGWAERKSKTDPALALQVKLHYSDHKADEIPDTGHDSGCKEFGARVVLKKSFFNDLFYAGIMGGLGYLGERVPEWVWRDENGKSSHILGSWGILAGKDWPIVKSWVLKTEVGLVHTSDVFRHDRGKNFAEGTVGIGWRF